VPADTEAQVPNLTGGGTGDGNGDDTPDASQSHVTSIETEIGSGWATIENLEGHALVQVSAGPAPADAPSTATFPFGMFNFTVEGVAPGATVTMDVYVDHDPNIVDYMKLDHFTGTWNRLGATVVQISTSKTRIRFQLTDGDTYDGDLTVNGSIDDPGGPVRISGNGAIHQIPVVSHLGLWLLGSLLGLFGMRRLGKRGRAIDS
jgi:hypothetical protein